MNDTTITRRHALRTGSIAALAASLLGTTTTPAVAAEPAPTIDEAERLIVSLAGILSHLSERDGSNIGHVLDQLGRAAGSSTQHLAQAVADALADIGPGNRVHDRIDREIAAEKRAAVTHGGVVEHHARRYDAGEVGRVGEAIRSELMAAYGDELGAAIAGAAFHLHLHDRYDHVGAPAACGMCWD